MDARLDPGCDEARALVRQQTDRDVLLVGGSGGMLAGVVRQTQEAETTQHLVRCARCRHFDPHCAECGFEPSRERHGWMCKAQPSRWADIFPWNWRASKAPKPAATWRHVTTPSPARPDPKRVEFYRPPTPPSAPTMRARPVSPRPDSLAVAYASLGISMDAAQDAVRAAYRSLAQRYHPDKVAHMAPEFREVAEKKMTEINSAYERIKRSWT